MGEGDQAIHRRTLAGLAKGLAAGEFSSRELTEALLGRIAKHQATLNAFITVTADEALDQADRADRNRKCIRGHIVATTNS